MNKYGIGYSADYLSVNDIKGALISHVNNDSKAMQIKQSLGAINKSDFFMIGIILS